MVAGKLNEDGSDGGVDEVGVSSISVRVSASHPSKSLQSDRHASYDLPSIRIMTLSVLAEDGQSLVVLDTRKLPRVMLLCTSL